MTAIDHAPRSVPFAELKNGDYPCQACGKSWPCAGYDSQARSR